MKKQLLIALLCALTLSVSAQSKKAKKEKAATTVPPAPVSHTITVTLPENDMQLLLGSAGKGIGDFLMTTQIPANQLQQTSDYFNKSVYPQALQQLNQQLKTEQDSLTKSQAKADSIKKASTQK